MPQTPTPNRALVAPALGDLPDGPDAYMDLALQLDNVASIFFGTLASLGAASASAGTSKGSPGTFYWATDTGQLFLSVAGAWIELAISADVPIGAALEYGGAGDPTDTHYLLEDGRALTRTGLYAPLFAVLGTTYGAGNGTTTFNIPDSRGRVTVGPDNMGTAQGDAARLTALDGRGNVGGAEKHILATGELPSHTHGPGTLSTDTEAAHTHTVSSASPWTTGWNAPINDSSWTEQGAQAGFGFQAARFNGANFGYTGGSHTHTLTAGGSHAHTVTGGVTAATGSGTGHNNMQPYVVKNKIIRVR